MTDHSYWKDHFEQQAAEVDDHAEALDHSNEAVMAQVHDAVVEGLDDDRPVETVLDVGCGTGDLTARVAATVTGDHPAVYAVDISREMLGVAREELVAHGSTDSTAASAETGESAARPARYAFAQMAIPDLAVRPGSVDVVVASEALQYVDPYEGIAALLDLLAPGGQVVAVVPNREDDIVRRAERRNDGRYHGVELDRFVESMSAAADLADLTVKPLVFAEDQSERPYERRPFESDVSAVATGEANRLVVAATTGT